jgi:transcription elongation factor GreA
MSTAHDPTSGSIRPDVAILTSDGRRLIREHIRRLESQLDELRQALAEETASRDATRDAEQAATHEIEHLRSLLETALPIDDVAEDPTRVQLGDTVRLGLADGSEESYTIVHSAEALFDDTRISTQSPLASALLGRRVGEVVTVEVPAGTYECRVLSADRQDQRT